MEENGGGADTVEEVLLNQCSSGSGYAVGSEEMARRLSH